MPENPDDTVVSILLPLVKEVREINESLTEMKRIAEMLVEVLLEQENNNLVESLAIENSGLKKKLLEQET